MIFLFVMTPAGCLERALISRVDAAKIRFQVSNGLFFFQQLLNSICPDATVRAFTVRRICLSAPKCLLLLTAAKFHPADRISPESPFDAAPSASATIVSACSRICCR